MFSSSQRQLRGGRNDKVRCTRRWYGIWWFGALRVRIISPGRRCLRKKQALEKAAFLSTRGKSSLCRRHPFSHRSDLGRSSLALPAEVLTLSSSGLIAVACKSGKSGVRSLRTRHRCDTSSHRPWLHTILSPQSEKSSVYFPSLLSWGLPCASGPISSPLSSFLFPFDVAPPVGGEGDIGIKSPFFKAVPEIRCGKEKEGRKGHGEHRDEG